MLWHHRLQALIKKPGKWALIAIFEGDAKSKAHQLRSALQRRRYSVPRAEDNWEFVTRKGKVYARYVGEPE